MSEKIIQYVVDNNVSKPVSSISIVNEDGTNEVTPSRVSGIEDKIGDLSGQGITEGEVAKAIKNDRLVMSNNTNQINTANTKLGNLSNLTTDNKIDLVQAINEHELQINSNTSSLADHTTKINTNTSNITTLQSQVTGLSNGSPIPVTLASQMTDHTRNYVYLGSESGYTAGNLYYWNGSSFANSGRQYQSTGIADNSIAYNQINQDVFLEANITSVVPTYTNGLLTKVEEKNGSTTIALTNITYDSNNNVLNISETRNGKKIISTFNYDTNGILTSISRAVG